MKLRKLLALGLFALAGSQVSATIVNGVRQKPVPTTMSFSVGTHAYLYNIGAKAFFTEGNAYGTQASVGDEGLEVYFSAASGQANGVYEFYDYSKVKKAWKNVFFAVDKNGNVMYVDRAGQADWYWEVENNGDTFRLLSSDANQSIQNFGGYVGLNVADNADNTALSHSLDPGTGHYVDWAYVSTENYATYTEELKVYNRAQELKDLIDKIKALNGDASSAETVYGNESSTIAEIDAAIDAAQTAYVEALINSASDKDNVDVTSLLKNPEYEDGTNGWTVNAASGGNVAVAGLPTNKCFEAWNNSSFDIYQKVNNAPEGVYEIEVQGFYRYLRDDNAWNAYKAQQVDYVKPQGVPVYVYLNNNQTPFKNVFSEPVNNGTLYTTDASLLTPGNLPPYQDGEGHWYPNEMYNSAVAFNAGMYKQSAFGLVRAGDVMQIGVKGASNQGGDSWVIWDNFKLIYRGMKPEVIQPVLETAVADVEMYKNMPMGKTQYAALIKGLQDAETAIDEQDGTKMFAALNDLYDVKSDVQASKDLFASKGVTASITSLSDAIDGVAGKKLSAATLANANTLLTGLKDNTIYEDIDVDNIATDVSTQITALNNSVSRYEQLESAIDNLNTAIQNTVGKKLNATVLSNANTKLQEATDGYNNGSYGDDAIETLVNELNQHKTNVENSVTEYKKLVTPLDNLLAVKDKKAQQTITDAANTLYTETLDAYSNGTIANADIDAKVTVINNMIDEVNASADKYVEFNTAIGNLETAVNEASVPGARISQETLSYAKKVLSNSQTNYNNSSYNNTQITNRIDLINNVITNLTKSINLYKDFATAIDNLNTEIETSKTKKLSAATLQSAETLLATAQTEYNDGTLADENVAARNTELGNMVQTLRNSVSGYETLVQPLADLLAVKDKKAQQTITDAANTLYTVTLDAYNNGTIADADIDAKVTKINNTIAEVNVSAAKYVEFATAIDNLNTEIETSKTKKLSAATLQSAETLLATAQTEYNDGTLPDGNVAARNTELGNMVQTLKNSVSGYETLQQSLDDLETAIENANNANVLAQTKVDQGLIDEATVLFNNSKSGYNNGTIPDADVTATVNSINDKVAALNQAVETAQVTLTIGDAGFATFVSEQPISFVGSGVKAYTATLNSEKTSAHLDEVTEIPALTPVVVEGQKGVYTLTVSTAPVQPVSNDLIVVEDGVTYQNLFVLANKSQGVGFYPWKGASNPVGKVAIDIPNAAREFIGFESDETTGIMSAARINATATTIYDLQGHKLDKITKKGLYIVDGHKVVVK